MFEEVIVWFKTMFDVSSPLRIVLLIIDVLMVILLVYYIYSLIRKTKATKVLKWMLLAFLLLGISQILDLRLLNFVLDNFLIYGGVCVIVAYQPELRAAFERLGSKKYGHVYDVDDKYKDKQVVSEITKAVEILSLKKIGALIVIEQTSNINDVIREGVDVSATLSSELIQTIFNPRTPLRDGALIVSKGKIKVAGCTLPLAPETVVPKNLGTRHRAAVGISQMSDALVIVISEETGIISYVEDGHMERDMSVDKLSSILIRSMDNNREKLKISKAQAKIKEKSE